MPLARWSPLTTCLRWLQIEAVLAPDATQAQTAWARADALLRLVSSGTQTLLGQAIAWNWVMRQQQLLAAWSAEQPAGSRLPAAWLAPLPQQLLQPQRWMAAELQYQREITADLRDNAGNQLFGIEPNAWEAWAGRHSLGFLPELTMQTLTARWMNDFQQFGRLQGAALAQVLLSRPQREPSSWQQVSWRNTVGHILTVVAEPQSEYHALRQADLALSQAALELSQQLNAVPAAARSAWWARQPIDAGLRERLTLDGDSALLARTWGGGRFGKEKSFLRFPLRPS